MRSERKTLLFECLLARHDDKVDDDDNQRKLVLLENLERIEKQQFPFRFG